MTVRQDEVPEFDERAIEIIDRDDLYFESRRTTIRYMHATGAAFDDYDESATLVFDR